MADETRSAASGFELIREQFVRVAEFIREQEMIVAAHPDDVTPELRALIAGTPHATLRESRYVEPGKLFVIHPGLLTDLADGHGTTLQERRG